ncbi:MAG: cell envelope integrity protein CreD [Gammaproteobacteria bacterium]|nr:cell envelope integrity protein CreD [Gammaproteobacteria bacterium]
MTDTSDHPNPDDSWLRRNISHFGASVTFRFVLVIAIVLALMIPLFLVSALVLERSQYLENATQEIGIGWGGSGQRIVGPFILVRAEQETTTGTTRVVRNDDRAYMPKQLNLDHATTHTMKSRGIYKVPVFRATLDASATFPAIEFDDSSRRIESISLVLGITDGRGLRADSILWNGVELTDFTDPYSSQTFLGNTLQVDLTEDMLLEASEVELRLKFRGSRSFVVVPVGDTSNITMRSDWPHPKFIGTLPDVSEEISSTGFEQSWTVHKLARGFDSDASVDAIADRLGTGAIYDPVYHNTTWSRSGLAVGYDVLNLNTDYRDIRRAITYGLFFVVLTLVSILCLELVSKIKFHIVQYGVVGIGLVLFFLTLLALTEHIGFVAGYVLASFILTAMNTTYVWFITRTKNITITIGIFLVMLYSALYFILQLDNYALLAGVALLLVLLGGLMFATKNLQRLEQES